MDRLAFEQLINAWLDDPRDVNLRREIEAACAAEPACGRVLKEYEKLASLIRLAADRPLPVNWANLKSKISSAAALTEPGAADPADLDKLVREALPALESRVNWDCYARRVSEAVHNSARGGRVLRLPRWRASAAVAGLAAAAALILWIGLPSGEAPVVEPGAAPAVAVSEPLPSALAPPAAPAITTADQNGPVMVRVRVIEEPAPAPAVARAAGGQGSPRVSEPEVFFMLEPPDRTVFASAAGLGSY